MTFITYMGAATILLLQETLIDNLPCFPFTLPLHFPDRSLTISKLLCFTW